MSPSPPAEATPRRSITARRLRDQLRGNVRRLRRYPEWRRAKYPWNRLIHEIRWRLWSPERIERWSQRRLGLDGHAWIFVAGCNNSGTTLIKEVLASHPTIRALPREGQALTPALPTPTHLGVPRLFTRRLDELRWTEESDPRPALRCRYDFARYCEPGPGHLVMKSPENTVRTRWLQRHFQPARFVAIVRSAYAVAEGTRRRSGHSIADAARHWRTANELLLADLEHLERKLLLRYEDFCSDPQAELLRLQDLLDLPIPFGAEALAPRGVHNIDGKRAAIKSFNAKSLERLDRGEIEAIHRIAGPLMEELGYALV